MLQTSEYSVKEYVTWQNRTDSFSEVMRRGELKKTQKSQLILLLIWVILLGLIALGAVVFWYGLEESFARMFLGVIIALAAPLLTAYIIIIPLWFGEILIQKPKEKRMIINAKQKLKNHKALRIAVVGSYGKTTCKEILKTVLSESKKVAAAPGNMNTLIGTSRFIDSLSGDEDILIFELGESHPGDVDELCDLIEPDMGIITGINEAHLSTFKKISKTIETIFEVSKYVNENSLYKNGESEFVLKKVSKHDPMLFTKKGVNGWQVKNVVVSIHGTKFTAQKENAVIWAETGLLGEHNIGALTAAIDIAQKVGLAVGQIADGIKKTGAFEHRMQPRQLHGAWIIDDTYNGNKEGVAAGLKLLKQLEAKRRVYITPGLVEQGDKTNEIHKNIGEKIAVCADVVVLMQNSATEAITSGLKSKNFNGQLKIIDNPLEFYENIEQFIAAGDIVLMQNDWTDNYA